ncbi:5-aminolevulinate synthase [Brenneria goodwinii]|uniref:5-aminolevulinate synthase n=1 Tax=Brenneria goodwinii TaxID=1109412 RepID=UPI0036E609B3
MYEELLDTKLNVLKASGQYRNFITLSRICGQYPLARVSGHKEPVVIWCSNDYLGMSQHQVVREAMHRAIDAYGAGSGGSRNIGGTHELFAKLEKSLAKWHSKEAALVFPTGFSSNEATLQSLLRQIDDCVVISDQFNHASIINGIRSTNNAREIFRHNDMQHLEQILAKYPKKRPKIIVFESVYSMDGDTAPIESIVTLAKRFNAFTYLDEVHAVGMYGPHGAGLAADKGVAEQIDIIQGTMAKAIGVIGGYIASSKEVVDTVRSFASGFIFTTALPPAIVSGCMASVEHIKNNAAERIALQHKTATLRQALEEHGIPVMKCSTTHVLPVLVGDATKCKTAAERLLTRHHIYLQPINYPSVPVGTERFRVNATPCHSEEQMNHLATALRETFDYFNIPLNIPSKLIKVS